MGNETADGQVKRNAQRERQRQTRETGRGDNY